MFLFIISVGLSVTMGLMGVVNLAHGAFAMAGGYLVTTATASWGVYRGGTATVIAAASAAVFSSRWKVGENVSVRPSRPQHNHPTPLNLGSKARRANNFFRPNTSASQCDETNDTGHEIWLYNQQEKF